MSITVVTRVRLTAGCQELARQKLSLSPLATLDLKAVAAAATRRMDLSAIQEIVSAQPVRLTLSALAPVAFDRVSQLLTFPRSAAGRVAAASARAELAAAVAIASAAISVATRDVTAEAFAEAGVELGYTVSVCRADAATGIELRRGHEAVLIRVGDGGTVESGHDGPADAACGERQGQLEEAAARRGIQVTHREPDQHGSTGSEL